MRLVLIGYGRMGHAVESVAGERGHEVMARLTTADNIDGAALTPERLADVDVVIDFTRPDAAPRNIERAAGCGVDVVVGTTGWYEQLGRVRKAVESAETGLLYAPNFSIGTQLFFQLARQAARLAERVGGYDAYVLEAHHRHKADHPSGTALRLIDILLEELSSKTRWELGPGKGTVDPSALQVTAIRGGENPGMHSFTLDGSDDRIEVRHEARGRAGFARGAVAAAEWIHGRKGVFTLDEMLADTLGQEPTNDSEER
ncbi:MAG: 4-hydroxy-tetrahydrodipicolinate reductase [Gemmatimonadota bacterium]